MRITLKLCIASALFAATFSTLQAQETGKKHEIGLQFNGIDLNGFNSFNVLYRKQKSENVYRRIRASFGDINVDNRNETTRLGFSARVNIGQEKRKLLDRKLEFYRGPEFGLGFGFSGGDVPDNRVNVNASFGYVLGLQHSFNELWAVNLEAIPGIAVRFSVGDVEENDSFGLDAYASTSVSLGVVRKF